jgi:hypothetical protein
MFAMAVVERPGRNTQTVNVAVVDDAGFTFVARQKRITLDGDDYYIDLLFYHRRLRRLVVIELKLGEFKPADTGQVELYLRWLDRPQASNRGT